MHELEYLKRSTTLEVTYRILKDLRVLNIITNNEASELYDKYISMFLDGET